MTMLTPNFSLAEMTRSSTARRLNINNVPTGNELKNLTRTAEALEKIREYIDAPISVSSGYRSPRLNTAIGGSKTSAHRYGSAADIDAAGYTSPQLAEKILEMMKKGMINIDQLILEYPERGAGAWVHVGFRWNSPMRGQVLTITQRGTRSGLVYK